MSNITLKDVTASTWATLSNPPNGTAAPTHASALCLRDVATCKKDTADRIDDKPDYARNTDWNPRPLPRIVRPFSWPFLQRPLTRKSAVSSDAVFDLAFVEAPPAGYTVRIYEVTYGAATSATPRVVAVAFPADLDISEPPAFLVHFKHIPGQLKGATLFQYFDPLGYDWLAFEIWRWLNYTARARPDGSFTIDMPFLSPVPSSFGFCYQLRQAQKPYVIVLPQVIRTFDQTTQKLRDYRLYSAAMLRELLLAVQKDILSMKDDKLAHVAISCNSSGANVVSSLLAENFAASKKDKAIAEFMSDELNEVFVLDPAEGMGNQFVTALGGWLGLQSSRKSSKGKCVRFYTHSFTEKFATLAGGKSPFKAGVAGFWESPSKTLSIAYLPFTRGGDDIWQHTYDEIFPANTLSLSTFDFVHHAIPALCLTHAAASSLYV